MKSVTQGLTFVQISQNALEAFLQPFTDIFPDRRLQRNAKALVQGILVSQSPHITRAMQTGGNPDASPWAQAKRGYRLLHNTRVTPWQWTKSLYRAAQRTVQEEGAEMLVVAIDPVQFEKPYARRIEGVSPIYKSTPPNRQGKARLTWGYPAITAMVVNLSCPAVTYAHWFSYRSEDFLSQNREIQRALRMTRALFPHHTLCFVMDAAGDDRKFFAWVAQMEATFIVRVGHPERIVEVWKEAEQQWESTTVGKQMEAGPWRGTFWLEGHGGGKTWRKQVRLRWHRIRLPEERWVLSLVVLERLDDDATAEDGEEERLIGLLTNRKVETLEEAQAVYQDWRMRHRIEDHYRLLQEAGLDIEQVMVRTLARMQRMFVAVLWAMLFVTHILAHWPQEVLLWLRWLGGDLPTTRERSGLYRILWGLSRLWLLFTTLYLLTLRPPPSFG